MCSLSVHSNVVDFTRMIEFGFHISCVDFLLLCEVQNSGGCSLLHNEFIDFD